MPAYQRGPALPLECRACGSAFRARSRTASAASACCRRRRARLRRDGHAVVVEHERGRGGRLRRRRRIARPARRSSAPPDAVWSCDAHRQGEGVAAARSTHASSRHDDLRLRAAQSRSGAARRGARARACASSRYETVRDAQGVAAAAGADVAHRGPARAVRGRAGARDRSRRRGRAAVRRRRRSGRRRRRDRRRQRRRRSGARRRAPRCRVTLFSRGAARLATRVAALAASGPASMRARSPELGDDALRRRGRRRRSRHRLRARARHAVAEARSPARTVRAMRAGSAIVDVGIDQGGIAETSRMTKLSDSDVRRERRRALRGAQHAVAGRAHRDARAHGGDAAVRARDWPGAASHARSPTIPALAAGAMVWDGAVAIRGLPRTRG